MPDIFQLDTLTIMDYSKEVEELLLWFKLVDWWEDTPPLTVKSKKEARENPHPA